MLTSHDNRISPFPCLLVCLTVPVCLCIRSTAVKWIWISELDRSLPLLSFVLSLHIVFACPSADQQQLCRMKQSCRRDVNDGDFVKLINTTVPKRVLIFRTWSFIRTFLTFWVLIGSLFIFQCPSFHYFGFIHAKNVNSVCMYATMWTVYTVGKFWFLPMLTH